MRFLLFLSLLLTSLASYSFDLDQCVKSESSILLKHSNVLWGLVEYNLKVDKKRCLITLNRDKFFKSQWGIDICRAPIHIKALEYFTEKKYLKDEECKEKTKNSFCKKKNQLLRILERELLLNAKGEREDSSSQHGKSHCIYELMRKYLDGKVFSMSDNYSLNANKKKEIEQSQIAPKIKEDKQDFADKEILPAEIITEDELKHPQEKQEIKNEIKIKTHGVEKEIPEFVPEKKEIIKDENTSPEDGLTPVEIREKIKSF